MSSTANSNSLNIPETLSRAYAHWEAGQADQAEWLCQRVLAVWPGQADALHLLGLMAHAYGNLDLAITHLRQACMAPRAPAAYSSNLAEMCRQKGLLAEGEEAAQRAVAMDPTLVSAWNNLGILQQEAGKLESSLACLERVIALKPEWAEAHNNLANTCKRLGRLDRAEKHYGLALDLNPNYAEAHSNLAFLLTARGAYDQAEAEGNRAIELNPQLADAYLNLAAAQIARRRYDAALRTLDALHNFAPQYPPSLIARAQTLKQLERLDDALEFAQRATALAPGNAEAHNALGQILQALGQVDEALAQFDLAIELPGSVKEEAMVGRASLLLEAGRKTEAMAAFELALAAFPDSSRILVGRADIKVFRAGDPDIAIIEAFLNEGGNKPLLDRILAQFALGKAYLDIGDSSRAFHYFDTANRQKRATFAYDSAATGKWLERIAKTFTAELFDRLRGAGAPSELPVFVIGMPRSGTTLIEQILSSHSQVFGAGELSALRQVIERHGEFPGLMTTLGHDDLAQIGQAYLSRIAPLAGTHARLIDKMPGNFFYAGLIALSLPGARIIHCRRDPVDTCLSCYTKLFAGEQSFTYEQTELGEFYTFYQELMTHWTELLPADRYTEVAYEAVVDDLEGEARRLVDFLGLPWEDACLSFHDNRRMVRTASLNQVRRPIYKTSKGRWQAHAEHLGPLLQALGVKAS